MTSGLTRRDLTAAAALVASTRRAIAVQAEIEEEIRRLYGSFLDAQNARNLRGVRRALWNSPDFLWVSDGRPFWGVDALVARLAVFQMSDVWKVEAKVDRSRVVSLAANAAYLAMPLVLTVGSQEKPMQVKWLVGVLCRRKTDGWHIAALFTTEDKSG